MLLGGTPHKKPESTTVGNDEKVRRWRGGREEGRKRGREVFISEPHTEDSYSKVRADPTKKVASFVKVQFSVY